MGVTVDAIRKRLPRAPIPRERDEDDHVLVALETGQRAAVLAVGFLILLARP